MRAATAALAIAAIAGLLAIGLVGEAHRPPAPDRAAIAMGMAPAREAAVPLPVPARQAGPVRGRELVILDRALSDLEGGLRQTGRQVILVGGPEGLRDAARQLPVRSRFAAIHIVSHGTPGQISLDGAQLGVASFGQGDGAGLKALSAHLAPDGDILVYGCESASGREGRELLLAIAGRTGADVAASARVTGIGDWSLEQRLGTVGTSPLRLPRPTRLWTNELYEGGWFGDSNVPTGAVAPHAKAGQTGSGRLSSMGDNTGGSGVTFSVQSLGCCTAQTIAGAGTSSYASAVSANDFFFSNIVVGGTNGATITKFQYNQVNNNTSGAQFVVALYDTVTATLTPIVGPITVSGSTTSIQVSATRVGMVAGRTYQLRFYGYSCGSSATCYIDNPQIWTQANEAPSAASDSFATPYVTAVSGNVTSNDSDPESQSLTVSTINGNSYGVGVPIALAGGSLTMTSASGAFTFTPASGFYGSQSFTYGLSDGFGGTATGTATIRVNQADLSLAKTVASAFAFQGASQSFTLTVTSSAASSVTATGITVTDVLPAGFSFTSATGSGSYNSSTGVWTVGSLAPGASASLTINGTVTAAPRTVVTDPAEISASSVVDPDSTPNNGATGEDDYATASFTVIDPRLSVSKTSQLLADGINSTNFKAVPGASLRYCLLITNTGNTTATNVIANDSLPAQVSYVSGSARTGTSCATASSTSGLSVSGSTITATSASLGPAQTFAVIYDVKIS